LISDDGYRWEVQPPACTPRNSYDYECPSVFKLGGKYYMVAIHGGHQRETYRVADRIEGPYRRPWDDALMPGNSLSHRPCLWRNQQYLFHWITGVRDWGTRHPGYQTLASPKWVHVDADGSLRLESFDWSREYESPAGELTATSSGSSGAGEWHWNGSILAGVSEFGTGAWLLNETVSDFELCAEVKPDPRNPAREFGFIFRADETGDRGMYVRCVPGRFCCELVRQYYNRRNGPDSLHRGRSVLQTYHLPPSTDGTYRLRLIAYGPNLEFNVNGRLSLATLSMPERSGRLGIFIEDGTAVFSSIRAARLRPPATNWDL
jgi:hypothetical protein